MAFKMKKATIYKLVDDKKKEEDKKKKEEDKKKKEAENKKRVVKSLADTSSFYGEDDNKEEREF